MNPSYTDLLACFAVPNITHPDLFQPLIDHILENIVPGDYTELLNNYEMLNSIGVFIHQLNEPPVIFNDEYNYPEFVDDDEEDNGDEDGDEE